MRRKVWEVGWNADTCGRWDEGSGAPGACPFLLSFLLSSPSFFQMAFSWESVLDGGKGVMASHTVLHSYFWTPGQKQTCVHSGGRSWNINVEKWADLDGCLWRGMEVWSRLGILGRLWWIWFWTWEVKRKRLRANEGRVQGLMLTGGWRCVEGVGLEKEYSFFSLICQLKDCSEPWFLCLIIFDSILGYLNFPNSEGRGEHCYYVVVPTFKWEFPCKHDGWSNLRFGMVDAVWSCLVCPWSNLDNALVLLKLHSHVRTLIFQMDSQLK